MAITYNAQPGKVNFCKNPIIVRALTNLRKKTFLNIICEVSFALGAYTYSEKFSHPVADEGEAIFNLSLPSQVLYNRLYRQLLDGTGWDFRLIRQSMTVLCYESWIDNGIVITGVATAINGDMYVYPGGLTDFERLKASSSDIESLLGDYRFLSRKPNAGIVYPGETIFMPYFAAVSNSKETASAVYDSDTPDIRNFSRSSYYVSHETFKVLSGMEGKQLTTGIGADRPLISVVAPLDPRVKLFRFINGFGMMENIAVRSNETLKYNITSNNDTLFGDESFQFIKRRIGDKNTGIGKYGLESGPVTMQWAEWFIHEFLPTPIAWMYEQGVWIPGTITCEDDFKLYDKAKPGILSVAFFFKRGIDGGTLNSFI